MNVEEQKGYWGHPGTSTRTRNILSYTVTVSLYHPKRKKTHMLAIGSIFGEDRLTQPEPYLSMCMHLESLGDQCATLSHDMDIAKIARVCRCMCCRKTGCSQVKCIESSASLQTKDAYIHHQNRIVTKETHSFHCYTLSNISFTNVMALRLSLVSFRIRNAIQQKKIKTQKSRTTPFYIPERISSTPKGTSPKM